MKDKSKDFSHSNSVVIASYGEKEGKPINLSTNKSVKMVNTSLVRATSMEPPILDST